MKLKTIPKSTALLESGEYDNKKVKTVKHIILAAAKDDVENIRLIAAQNYDHTVRLREKITDLQIALIRMTERIVTAEYIGKVKALTGIEILKNPNLKKGEDGFNGEGYDSYVDARRMLHDPEDHFASIFDYNVVVKDFDRDLLKPEWCDLQLTK